MYINFNDYMLFLSVFARLMGMLVFNPFFGRKNVPVIIKMGLALFIAVITVPFIDATYSESPSFLSFLIVILKEMFIGFAISFVMQLFLSVPLIAGEMSDMQLGINMSKVYDPQSNISMPLTGTIYNIMYILLFFSSNSHLTLIHITADSFTAFPPGYNLINFNALSYIVYMFGDILILSVKLAVPIIAIEMLVEAGLGMIMRMVPQINVFVVGLPLKLIIGFATIVFLAPTVSRMFDVSGDMMFNGIQKLLANLPAD